jgi:hypothetical protein
VDRFKATYTVGPNFSFGLALRKFKELSPALQRDFRKLDFSR